MLCEERGLFLEIADIVRGLGLTILKGIMETRNDKIWARFAVEVTNYLKRILARYLHIFLWEDFIHSALLIIYIDPYLCPRYHIVEFASCCQSSLL